MSLKLFREILQSELTKMNMTIEDIHANPPEVAQKFWEDCADAYVEWHANADPEIDPKYRFDAEWREFWDTAERQYPQYFRCSKTATE